MVLLRKCLDVKNLFFVGVIAIWILNDAAVGVAADLSKCQKLQMVFAHWQPLAEKGNPDAQAKLGIMYENGYGVKRNRSEALKWFEKAADRGNLDALKAEVLISPDAHAQADARRHIYDKAERGELDAQFLTGYFFEHGFGGAANISVAQYWYRKAAHNGSADAQKALGDLYYSGALGWSKKPANTTPNYSSAFKWWKQAADQGNKQAQKELSALYEAGNGVERNLGEAYFWAMLADAPIPLQERLRRFLQPAEMAVVRKRVRAWHLDHPIDDASENGWLALAQSCQQN